MKTGLYVSGVAHGALVLWAVVGGIFQRPSDEGIRVSSVSVISTQEFEAITAPPAGGVPEAPEDLPPAPVETAEPVPPEPEPEPEQPDPEPPVPDEPVPTTAPESTPQDGADVALVDAPPVPVEPDTQEGAALVLAPDRTPVPRRAPRIAADPVALPEPAAEPAPTVETSSEAVPTETPEPPEPEPEREAQAPEDAVARTAPDAEDVESGGSVVSALAPVGSPRPKSRPRRPAPTADPDPASEPEEPTQTAEADPDTSTEDALAAALAEAVAETGAGTGGQGTADLGPPLTSGEKDALHLAIRSCWNVGSLSSEALRASVTLKVVMNRDGTPDIGRIQLVESSGGPAATQAFETARRAIIRCGVNGYDLPEAKYEQWKEITMIFDPERMRLR